MEDINVIIKKQLKKYLGERNFKTNVKVIDTFSTRSSPANAQDTRICWYNTIYLVDMLLKVSMESWLDIQTL